MQYQYKCFNVQNSSYQKGIQDNTTKSKKLNLCDSIQSNTVYLYVYEGFVFGIRQSMHVAGRGLGNERFFRTGMPY